MMKCTTMIAGAALASLLSLPLQAQTGTTAEGMFSLQGRLTTTGGGAVANGQHSLLLKVYMQGTNQVIYSETDNVTTMDGMFTTMVGDNGTSGGKLNVMANANYELGVSIDNGNEMSPRLRIGEALSAATADVAANAMAIGGLRLMNDTNRVNAIVTTDANGRLQGGLLDSNMVTSINGLRGNVNFTGGGNLNVSTTGNTVTLALNGGTGGGFSLPYTQTVNLGSGQTGLSLTNSGGGNVASFINSGAGTALNLQAMTGSAISATSNTSASGTGTINVTNTGGTAINAVGNASTGAVLQIQNTGSGSQASLISAIDASSNMAFQVMANGQTKIHSTVGNALDVSTSAAGEAALKVTGGLTLNGPVGTGTIDLTNGSVTINNAYAKANSVIMLTVTSGTNAASIVPIRLSSQGNGTFSVSAIQGALGTLTGSLSFNYLIINQ